MYSWNPASKFCCQSVSRHKTIWQTDLAYNFVREMKTLKLRMNSTLLSHLDFRRVVYMSCINLKFLFFVRLCLLSTVFVAGKLTKKKIRWSWFTTPRTSAILVSHFKNVRSSKKSWDRFFNNTINAVDAIQRIKRFHLKWRES